MDPFVQCEKENVSMEQVGREIESNKPAEKSRQCPICHVYYKYGNSYWQHVRYVHASFLSQCIVCEKCYKRTTMAKHHVLHSHKIAWHLCGNYVRKVRKADLQQQQQQQQQQQHQQQQLQSMHRGENLFSIKKTAAPKVIKRKILHLIRSFNCYDCNDSFTNIRELFNHVKVHKGHSTNSDDNNADDDDCHNDDTKFKDDSNVTGDDRIKNENAAICNNNIIKEEQQESS